MVNSNPIVALHSTVKSTLHYDNCTEDRCSEKGYKVINWTKYLVNLSHLLFVLKIQWCIKIWNFFIRALQNQVVFARMNVVTKFYNRNSNYLAHGSKYWKQHGLSLT